MPWHRATANEIERDHQTTAPRALEQVEMAAAVQVQHGLAALSLSL